MELLEKRRKKFDNYNAIYFVSPSKETVQLIKKDFVIDAEYNPEPPLYSYVHIIFNEPVDNKLIGDLCAGNQMLINNLYSLKQVCYTLHPIDEGLFSLKMSDDLNIWNKNKVSDEGMVNNILSILSFLRNVQNIQITYDRNNNEMSKIVQDLTNKIQSVIDTQFDKSYMISKPPPVFLILLDRKEDLVTPLLQNDSYSSMFYNLLDKRENVLEFEVKDAQKKQGTEKEIGKCLLNETDFIWLEYKYKDFLSSIQDVQKAYQTFMEENASNNKNLDVIEQIRKAPQLKEYIKDYNKHLDNFGVMSGKFKENKFSQVFLYEQCIATGLTRGGKPFEVKEINKSNVPSEFDKKRLGLLAKLLQKTDDNSIQNIIFENRDPKMIGEINDAFRNIMKLSNGDLKTLAINQDADSNKQMFYKSRAADIVYNKITNNLLEKYDSFETKDFYPKNQTSNKVFNNYIFRKNALFDESCPIVIVFMKGGLSFNEVMEINNLRQGSNLGDFIPICGGTNVYSARTFFEYLVKDPTIVEEDKQ